jgi:hypothetical protein
MVDSPNAPQSPSGSESGSTVVPEVSRLRRFASWLCGLVTSGPIRILISMVLAVAVGYLLERALVDGWRVLIQVPDLRLTLTGLAAALFLIRLWFRDLNTAANAGVFFHAAIEDRSERPLAEDSLLRTWATETWEYCKVMPFVAQRPQPANGIDWPTVAATARRLNSQLEHSKVLAPGAKAASVLVHGRPDLIGPLGWMIGREWSDDRALRIVVDNTSDEREPFLIFDSTYPLAVRHPQGTLQQVQPAASEASTQNEESYEAVLLLPVRRTDQGPPKYDFLNPVPNDHQLTTAAAEWHVPFINPLPEEKSAYEQVFLDSDAVLAQLAAQGRSPRVLLQGKSPVALVFAAGFLAAKRGLHLGSARWDPHSETYEAPTWPPQSSTPPTERQRPVGPVASVLPPLNKRYWTLLVAMRAAGLGAVLPLFAGAFALLFEWGLARSQPDANPGDWAFLMGIMLCTGVILVVGFVWLRRRLFAPKVTIAVLTPPQSDNDADAPQPGSNQSATITKAARAPKQSFAHRRIEMLLEPDADPRGIDAAKAAAHLAERITATFTDVLAVLPEVDDVTVELPKLGEYEFHRPKGKKVIHEFSHEVIHHFSFGLRRTLRGNKPVTLNWHSGQDHLRCSSGPGTCTHE